MHPYVAIPAKSIKIGICGEIVSPKRVPSRTNIIWTGHQRSHANTFINYLTISRADLCDSPSEKGVYPITYIRPKPLALPARNWNTNRLLLRYNTIGYILSHDPNQEIP